MSLRSIIRSRFPFFLLLLPAFIVIHIEKDYSRLINYSNCTKEILILFLAPLAIYAVAWFLYRSLPKSNLFALITVFFFFFFGDIKDFLSKHFPERFIQSYTFLFPLLLLIIVSAGIMIKRSAGNFGKFFRFIHLALLLFIIMDLAMMAWPEKKAMDKALLTAFEPCTQCPKPDIYFILMDEYTSSANMQHQFGYDNSAIDNYLKSKEFSIATNSTSNYNLTAFSLSSIFSMNYLSSIDTSKDFHLKNYLPGVELMYETPLLNMFSRQGYKVFNNSIFEVKNYPSLTPLKDMWGTRLLYQQHNILRKMDNEIGWQFPSWMHIRFGNEPTKPEAQDIRDSLALQKLFSILHEKSSAPKFVYTHLMTPHFPFIRDSTGVRIGTPESWGYEKNETDYIGQVALANRLIRQVVDSITSISTSPPVIIIQGDHGYRPRTRKISDSQFKNFNAMYFPGNMKPEISDTMSSVNTFRMVFNQLFNTNYPLLGNRHYFLKYWPL